jgi:hypothetical protein
MDSLVELAARLDEAARAMTRAGTTLAHLDPGGVAFGGAGPGRLGETGRALHNQLVRAIGARSREAAAAGARLADTAQALRWAAAGYLDVDDAARRDVHDAAHRDVHDAATRGVQDAAHRDVGDAARWRAG